MNPPGPQSSEGLTGLEDSKGDHTDGWRPQFLVAWASPQIYLSLLTTWRLVSDPSKQGETTKPLGPTSGVIPCHFCQILFKESESLSIAHVPREEN